MNGYIGIENPVIWIKVVGRTSYLVRKSGLKAFFFGRYFASILESDREQLSCRQGPGPGYVQEKYEIGKSRRIQG